MAPGSRGFLSSRRVVVLGAVLALLFIFLSVSYRRHVSDFAYTSAEALRYHLGSNDAAQYGSPYGLHLPSSQVDDEDQAGDKVLPLRLVERPDALIPETENDADSTEALVDDELAYRAHLEAEHGPLPPTSHSPTLGFSNIYVLSLPNRTDRRERMSKLARALGLRFTFVDATPMASPVITWIGERAAEVRMLKHPILADAYGVDESQLGGSAVGTVWLEPSLPDIAALTRPKKSDGRLITFPSLNDPRWGGLDWVSYLESHPALDIVPDNPNFNVTEAMWDKLERIPSRQINRAAIATWYSQTRVMELMRQNNDASALVLEDDVDIEWDVGRIWPLIRRRLPEGGAKGWEMAFLGHCWGCELSKPKFHHPFLHVSSEPRCLHGYALSSKGYENLLRILRDPWTAYQTPIDTAVPTLTRIEAINAYSVDPGIIIQSKDTPSDIQPGKGSKWRGMLADSTMDRIWRDEGHEIPEMTWKELNSDPSRRTNICNPRTAAALAPVREQIIDKGGKVPPGPLKDRSTEYIKRC